MAAFIILLAHIVLATSVVFLLGFPSGYTIVILGALFSVYPICLFFWIPLISIEIALIVKEKISR